MRRILLILSETFLILSAGILAAYVRLHSDASWEITHRQGWIKLLLVAIVIQFSFHLFDLYDLRASSHRYRLMVMNLMKAYITASAMLLLMFYAVPSMLLGRGVFLWSLALSLLATALWRLIFAWGAGHPQLGVRERILILGSGTEAIEIARATLERRTAGFQIIGFVDNKPELLGKSLINPSVIGLTENLPGLVAQHRIDRIVVAVEDRRGSMPTGDLLNLRLSGRVAVEESACFYERLTGKVAVEKLRPSWLIFSRGGRYTDVTERTRRVVNASLAAVGLLISLPLDLIIAIAIKLDSPGPILYRQERVGKNGRRFKIIKFRSMGVGAEEESGPVWAAATDPRATRVGRVLRKLRLDEIPQFVNVARGDMNFIGPRPERPEFVEQLSTTLPYYMQRHLIKPGLTGWAQICYGYGGSVEDTMQKLQYDLYYIKNRSLLLDIIIVFETIKIVLFGRGAR